MISETYAQLASFIWSVCSLLHSSHKRNELPKLTLPLTVLRRFDCLPARTKAALGPDRVPVMCRGLTT